MLEYHKEVFWCQYCIYWTVDISGLPTLENLLSHLLMASHTNPNFIAMNLLQHLTKIANGIKQWRIKANVTKSIYVTFTIDYYIIFVFTMKKDTYLSNRLISKNIEY